MNSTKIRVFFFKFFISYSRNTNSFLIERFFLFILIFQILTKLQQTGLIKDA